jgi:hypothetical protein
VAAQSPLFPWFVIPIEQETFMSDSNIGNIKPYGTPIREAIASGDTSRMRQQGESARRWLEQNPGHEHQGEVHAALRELEEALGTSS